MHRVRSNLPRVAMWTPLGEGARTKRLHRGADLICVGLSAWPILRFPDQWGTGATATMRGVVVLLAVGCLLTRVRRHLIPGLAALWLAVLLTALMDRGTHASDALLTVVSVCIATALRLRASCLAIALMASTYVLARWCANRSLAGAAADNVVMSVLGCGAICAFLGALVDETKDIDRAHERQLEAAAGSALNKAVDAVREEMLRQIHDELIPVLMSISDCVARSRETVRTTAGHVAERLSDLSTSRRPGRLADLLVVLAQENGVEVVLDERLDPRAADVRVDAAVAGAVERACAEAIRNARRHGGADRVFVSWRLEGEEVVLQLSDDGRGITRDSGAGWGITNSIREPMESIGGSVALNGVVQNGATRLPRLGDRVTVTLSWPHALTSESALVASQRLTMQTLPSATRLVFLLAVPIVSLRLYLAVRYSLQASHAPALLLLAGVLALGVLALSSQVTRRPLRAWQLVALGLCGAGLDALGLALAGPQSLHSYGSWVIGFVAVLLAVPALVVPVAWTLVLVLPSTAAVIATALADGYGLAAVTEPISASILSPIVISLLGVRIRSDARSARADAQRVRSLTERAGRMRLRSILARPVVEAIENECVPLLVAVARGVEDPADPRTGWRARLLALGLRDDLALPGLLDPHMRVRLRAARVAGASIHLSGVLPRESAAASLRLLDRILDLDPLPATVTVRLMADPDRARIDLRPPLPDAQHEALTARLRSLSAVVSQGSFSTRIDAAFEVAAEGADEFSAPPKKVATLRDLVVPDAGAPQ